MNKIIFLVILLLIAGCVRDEESVYRYYAGKQDQMDVWIVDGNTIRKNIFNEFLYGGNDQRYTFVPKGEIWIDNGISAEEWSTTLRHELNERHLMATAGWTYLAAHDSSLSIELVMRDRFDQSCKAHEASLSKVGSTDYSGKKEIKGLPDSTRLDRIYRMPYDQREGMAIWIVDGYLVRKNIYPDFGFSGNDLAYHFIPDHEIWIDGQASCEETEYSIALELAERKLMSQGKLYRDAYAIAVLANQEMRKAMAENARSHTALSLPDTLTRASGVVR